MKKNSWNDQQKHIFKLGMLCALRATKIEIERTTDKGELLSRLMDEIARLKLSVAIDEKKSNAS